MLLVKTKLGPSGIHGTGLFAAEFIPKGTMVQRFMPGFDLAFSEAEIAGLSEPARRQFLNYAYKSLQTGKYILCFDDARFLNHADQPNLESPISKDGDLKDEVDFAARDILAGEELTVDYRVFDADFDYKMKDAL